MIRAHRNAVLGLLEAVSNLTVYDGLVEDTPALPYVVLWTSAPERLSHSLGGAQTDAWNTFTTTAVGTTSDQVGWVQEKVHGALVDAPVTVSGRSCERIKHDTTVAVAADYDVTPHVLTAVDVWQFLSIPA